MSAFQRFGISRLWLNRLILWLSLFGMVLAVHLWIQKARGFDQGCLGLSKHAYLDPNAACREVNDLAASHLLGVSNAAWGYAFYFALVSLSFAKLLFGPTTARRFHALSDILVLFGFLYSGYLVYQMGFVVHSWCVLCLCSATTVVLLALAHAIVRFRGYEVSADADIRSAEIGVALVSAFGAMGLLAGIVVFVDRLGTRPLDQGSARQEIAKVVGETLPMYIDPAKLAEMRACHFDWDAKPLDESKFITSTTPFIGKPDGISVIVFLDPNCPHCREYLPIYLEAAERCKDRARFMILPRMLWDASIPQIEALLVASTTPRYFDLWRAMLKRARGPTGAMTVTEISASFKEHGLDATNLDQRLASQRAVVYAANREARRFEIDALPVVFIGGRRVWTPNRSMECIETLIERMLSSQGNPISRNQDRKS